MGGMTIDEFKKIGRSAPPAERPREWWDLFSVLGGIAVGVVWFLYGSLRIGSEGVDLLSPILMVGLPFAISRFRTQIDGFLGPIQPYRARFSRTVLVGMSLATPFLTAFLLSSLLGVSNYPLMHWNLVLGTAVSYVLVRDPVAGGRPGGPPPTAALLLVAVAFVLWTVAVPVGADDFLTDPLNVQDGLRTPGFAPMIAGFVGAVIAGLINAPVLAGALGGGPPPTVAATYTGKPAVDVLVANGLVTWDPVKGGYVPTPPFTSWLSNPVAGNLPVKGTRVVGEARVPGTGRVTDVETVSLTSLGGAGITLNPNGTINTETISVVANQTRPSGWQAVPPPAPPAAPAAPPQKPPAKPPEPEPAVETKPPEKPKKPPVTPKPPVKPEKPPVTPEKPPTTTTTVTPSRPETTKPPGTQAPSGGTKPEMTPEERERRIREVRASEARAGYWRNEGRFWNALTNIASFTSAVADVSVDFLSSLTGSTGKGIKDGYTAVRDVGKNTLVVEGGKGLRQGVTEAIVDTGFSAASDVTKKITGGKLPRLHAADEPRRRGQARLLRGDTRDEQLDGEPDGGEVRQHLVYEQTCRTILPGGGGTIVRDRLINAAAGAGQSQIRSMTIKDPIIKNRILGMGEKE